jgi:hypothetical protein
MPHDALPARIRPRRRRQVHTPLPRMQRGGAQQVSRSRHAKAAMRRRPLTPGQAHDERSRGAIPRRKRSDVDRQPNRGSYDGNRNPSLRRLRETKGVAQQCSRLAAVAGLVSIAANFLQPLDSLPRQPLVKQVAVNLAGPALNKPVVVAVLVGKPNRTQVDRNCRGDSDQPRLAAMFCDCVVSLYG